MTQTEQLRWKRDGRGRQVSACGRYAVQADGYVRSQDLYGDGDGDFVGGEWAAILVATNENLDWTATMREAKETCEAHLRWS